MKIVLEETMSLLDPLKGKACWVIGDVNGNNLAKLVWDKVGIDLEAIDANGNIAKYKLLDIVGDRINQEEKVTRIWNSVKDKSGKATNIDRILMICHEDATPFPRISNEELKWEPISYY